MAKEAKKIWFKISSKFYLFGMLQQEETLTINLEIAETWAHIQLTYINTGFTFTFTFFLFSFQKKKVKISIASVSDSNGLLENQEKNLQFSLLRICELVTNLCSPVCLFRGLTIFIQWCPTIEGEGHTCYSVCAVKIHLPYNAQNCCVCKTLGHHITPGPVAHKRRAYLEKQFFFGQLYLFSVSKLKTIFI